MELRHLRYFIAVAEELNFSRAAARLRIAQPSLSTQVRDLESELGLELFNRSTGRVSLTDGGRVFAAEAREILDRVRVARERAHDAVRGRTGELRIGIVGPVAFAFLPTLMARFHAAHPEISAAVHEISPRDQLDQLARGEIHAGFMPSESFDGAPRTQLAVRALLRCSLGVVLDKRHAFYTRKIVSLRDLKNETFIGVRLAGVDDHVRWIRRTCRQVGFDPRFGVLAESVDNLLSMVAAGLGITLIPKLADRPTSGGLVFRPLREKSLSYRLMIVTNPKFPSALLARFRKIALAEAAALQRRL